MGRTVQAMPWFGRLLTWTTPPGAPRLRQARYAGAEQVIECVGRLAADQDGVYPGWHLWRPPGTQEHPGQFGGYLGEDLALAKRLAEARIITGCPTHSTHDQPPSLFCVLYANPTSDLTVAGATVPAVLLADEHQPLIRVHRYDLTADPRAGTGGLLGQIRARIHRPADITTDPVAIDWTVHTADGHTTGTHDNWPAAYADLVAALATTRVPDRDVVCWRCGNHGDHLCGRQWRLANGRTATRPHGGSVHTVSGGLPSIGGHHR